MSLQKLAKHLETAGRNNDSMLVHMSPREVSGLQALARQHGGDLSINPNTGLVEAGFLDSILPTIAGLGLSLIPGVGPLAAAGLVGGGTAVASGSLEKGLMAGLGAYGGAGLGGSLAEAGTTAASQAAGQTAVTPAAIPSGADVAASNVPVGLQSATGIGQAASAAEPLNLAKEAADWQSFSGSPSEKVFGMQNAPASFGGNLDKVSGGFGDVTSSMSKAGDFASQNKGNLAMSAAPLAYGMANPNSSLFSKDEVKTPEKVKSTQRPYSFSTEQNEAAYSPGSSTAEQVYFDEPRFTALPTYTAKEGGLMGYAVGGAVENMSAQNALGGNMMYPQSQMQTPMYANPMMQRPMPSNVIQSGLDVPTQAYSGEQRMAQGGIADYALGGFAAKKAEAPASKTAYKFNPETQGFTKSVTDYREVKPDLNSFVESIGIPGFGSRPRNGTGGGAGSTPFSLFGALQTKYEPVTTETQLGGVSQPYRPAEPMPAYKDYRRSAPQRSSAMGDMNGFYNQMNQQLGGFSPETGGLRAYADGGMADGGYNLGGYSDGGRLLKGPGDGVSDSIPASIGDRQPARLADGEFVVPARIVSELGNGSTDAGARKLYAMMDRVQKQRGKTTGKGKVAINSKADKHMPA